MSNNTSIHLPSVLPIENPSSYKLHLACMNLEDDHPLDVFVRDRNEWDNWQRWCGHRNEFTRQFVFALMEFYPKAHHWLFGGIYEILSRGGLMSHSYKVRRIPESEAFVGRLKLKLVRPGRGRAFYFEDHYSSMEVSELLPEMYSGEAFCGYDSIDASFGQLETIYRMQRIDWKAALECAKGVYLITDMSNGKRYVGSAYGGTGLWSRWACYIGTGHGWNDELTRLIDKHGIQYARENFRFSLVEYFTSRTDDAVVVGRESYWKNVLLTRNPTFGYNKN